jgi:1-phosphatidylinositol phosphodiesterase
MNINPLKVQLILAAAISFTACKKQNSENAPQQIRSEKSAMALPSVTSFTMNNWMGALSDTMSLAQLSIPGTHDSGARK